MDALDRVLGPGRDLLYRVDAALSAGGAPADAPIWALLRRTGALPGDTLEFAAGLDVAALHAAADEVRARGTEFADERAAVDRLVASEPWQGSGAEVFTAQWHALSGHVGDDAGPRQPSLAGRLQALASYTDDLAHWAAGLRDTLAMTIADALASAEAVTLKGSPPMSSLGPVAGPAPAASGGPSIGQAAVTVGTRVLEVLVDAMRTAHDLHDEWSPWLAELSYHGPVASGPPGIGTTTRVEL